MFFLRFSVPTRGCFRVFPSNQLPHPSVLQDARPVRIYLSLHVYISGIWPMKSVRNKFGLIRKKVCHLLVLKQSKTAERKLRLESETSSTPDSPTVP